MPIPEMRDGRAPDGTEMREMATTENENLYRSHSQAIYVYHLRRTTTDEAKDATALPGSFNEGQQLTPHGHQQERGKQRSV